MKAIKFEATVTPKGEIAIPAEIAKELPLGELLHVVVRWNAPSDEDTAWRTQGRERFEAAYSPEDAVYDQLVNEAPTR
jgi:hypothetical protein